MKDLRETLFKSIAGDKITASLYADMEGILSGVTRACEAAENMGLTVDYTVGNGCKVFPGDLVMQICGAPMQIALAEDTLIAYLSKASGVATAAHRFVRAAEGKLRIVCGSWKKMPTSVKEELREAVLCGGAACRISDEPMVYIDKNYVDMFGGIQASLSAARRLKDRKIAIQVCGRYSGGDIVRETWNAVRSGADIVYVDSGKMSDIHRVAKEVLPTLKAMEASGEYRKIQIAFGGGVQLEQIQELKELGIDIVGVGRAIIDAPLLDLHMEITGKESAYKHSHNLLDKSELKIEGIYLQQGNLNQIASVVARTIGMEEEDVLVIDVRDGVVALDILKTEVDARAIVGKEHALLEALSKIEGTQLTPNAKVTSDGMLGWIAGDSEDMLAGLEQSDDLIDSISEMISKRVIVFPTGTEVESGEIEDTNTPMIMKRFEENGFEVKCGEILKDDVVLFTGKLRVAIEDGYGVIITTGGVGAEDKDHSVEAILNLDYRAATPYIAKFKPGVGRHSKEGIRIGVGKVGTSILIALPGPNDEVALCLDTVVQGIKNGWSKGVLASELAKLLRERLAEKVGVKHHHH